MKLENLFKMMVLGSALTITAVGCRHPDHLTPLPGQRAPHADFNPIANQPPLIDPSNGANGANQITSQGIPPTPGDQFANYIADPTALQAQTIHFEFDKSAVKASEEPKLEAVATYMKGNPASALRVEGNCDERGTEEYNRSLGERRALAAREYLVRLGVPADRIVTISYGEDKPVDPSHGESAWSQNRRDDFVVLNPPKP